ncbi:MAG: hypothetical protein NVS3B25_01870 [Hymenobacter sp.]
MKLTFSAARALALVGLALSLSFTARAQPAPTTILFVGNSFFHGMYPTVLHFNAANVKDENFGLPKESPRYEGAASESESWGGIPGIFKQLTDEAGLAYEVHLEAVSGQTLEYHYANALPLLQQPRWNTVVLQEYSTRPLPTRRTGNPAAFREYATRLEQAVHAANPAAKLYLYQTWARADLHYPPNSPYAGQPIDSMTLDLHTAYYGLRQQNPRFTGVAPAGDAWLRAVQAGVAQRNPYTPEPGKMDLWGVDHYHPSNWGAYLSALVLFGEITSRDPRAFGGTEQAAAALGIAPADAVSLQRIAFEQVQAARPAAFAGKPAGQRPAHRKLKRKAKRSKAAAP